MLRLLILCSLCAAALGSGCLVDYGEIKKCRAANGAEPQVQRWQTPSDVCKSEDDATCVPCAHVRSDGVLIVGPESCLRDEYFVPCDGVDGVKHQCNPCKQCSPGQYAAGCTTHWPGVGGAVSEGSCSVGTECGPGTCVTVEMNATADRQCAPVRAGTFSGGGNLPCRGASNDYRGEPCPLGQEQPERGQGRCNDCEPGKFAPQQGMVACRDVDVGHRGVQDASARWVSQEPCPAGTAEADRMCSLCPVGKYSPASGMAAPCTDAPRGHYTALAGASAPSPCARGSVQPDEGATSCLGCARGTYMPEMASEEPACIDCPAGSFQPSSKQSACLLCEPGALQADKASRARVAPPIPTSGSILSCGLAPQGPSKTARGRACAQAAAQTTTAKA